MKLIVFLLFTLTCFSQAASGQETETQVDLYASTSDFNKNDKVPAIAIIKEQTPGYIKIKNFIDPVTKKPIKRSVLAWALEVNDEKYFNINYSYDVNKPKTFVRLNIVGKLCAIFIDESSPDFLKNPPSKYQGIGLVGGLTAVAASQLDEMNTIWKDKNGRSKKILIINTTHYTPPFAYGNHLTRLALKKLLLSQHIDESVKEISFEQIIGIIEKYNLN